MHSFVPASGEDRKVIRHSCSLRVVFIAFLYTASAAAQGTLADYQRAERFLPGNLRHHVFLADVAPHWIEKTDRLWYRRSNAHGADFVLVDAEKNTSAPAFDHARLASALSLGAKHSYAATDLPFLDFEFVDEEKAISFSVEKAKWLCNLATYECKPDTSAAENPAEALSPNERWAAYVSDHNLYLRDVSTGTELQLTNDGIRGWDYATPLPSLRLMVEQRTSDVKQRAVVFWSPDSSKLVTYRIDSRNSGRFTSLQFVPSDQLRPRAFTYVYPLPGEVLAKAEPIIFDVQSGKRIAVQTPPLELPFQDGPGFEWVADSKSFYYDYDERGYKATELRMVDAATGEQKVLVREQSDSYVDPGETFFRFVDSSQEILWSSERDGWNHLFLYSRKTGQVEGQLTQGPWVVREIERVDEKNRRVYFLGSGREKNEDPYQTHLYCVGLDGKNLRLLTPENASHAIEFSPDGRFFIDNYSSPDLPGESVLRAEDGREIRTLEKADLGELQQGGWKFAEPFRGKAADGTTEIYSLIWRPSNFDPAKHYPVVEHVYTGPQGYFVPKTMSASLRLQAVAELGFIVVMVDGRGTVGRSRVFHQFSYRNLGGAFDDHVALIKQMGEKYPYMDLTRVGIFGTSAGAYGAAHAMLVHPEFYRVCVSISGDHDARLDKAWWNEAYQGYPVKDDYVAQSNVTMADRLQGHLLLEHGDIDDNVHPVETMRFADALMKANKNFDMLLVPNMYHGESGEHADYLVRRRWDYFVEHLLGVTPPAGFVIKEDRDPAGNGSRRRARR
jgi:dipeptidyl aminopeptidase/acylaminoacyl peptidase